MICKIPFTILGILVAMAATSGFAQNETNSVQKTLLAKTALTKAIEVSGLNGQLSIEEEAIMLMKQGIAEQRNAGYPDYNPRFAFVVVPSHQRLTVISVRTLEPVLTIPVGTGKNGLGFGSSQTPIGFFVMGGVRIAKDASAYIQTGDSKSGVSGVYAEIVYPPSHPNASLRGRVPNNVIIHGFNPNVSSMLRDRVRKIGKIPCTTGCPTPNKDDLPKLAPYLAEGAGQFDPNSNPNYKLRSLISSSQVGEYTRAGKLGDPILILNRPFKK